MSSIPPQPSTSSTTSRVPVKGKGVDVGQSVEARKMYTMEVRKAKKGSALMRRRIGVSDNTPDEDEDLGGGMSSTSFPPSAPLMSTDHYYGPPSPPKRKGIDWHLRLTQAFTAYLGGEYEGTTEGLDKMNKRLVHRKLNIEIMEGYLDANPHLLQVLIPKLLSQISTDTNKICTALSNLLYCLSEDRGNTVISQTAHIVKEYIMSPAALITLGNMTTNPYGRDLLTRNGTLQIIQNALCGEVRGWELHMEGMLWIASNLVRRGDATWLDNVNWKELHRLAWMGLHGYETSRNTFKEFAWLCAFAVARGGEKAEEEVRNIVNSFVGYICGKGVEEEFAIPILRVIGNLGVNPVARREVLDCELEEHSCIEAGRFWEAMLEIGTRPGIRKEVWWCLGNFIMEATTEFKGRVTEKVIEAGWTAVLGSVGTAKTIHSEFPTKLNACLRDSHNLDDIVNCAKTAKVLCDRSESYYPEVEEGLERVVEWGYGKGERGEWCCEVASGVIDQFTEMHEHEVDGIAPDVGNDGMFKFGSGAGLEGGGGVGTGTQIGTQGGGARFDFSADPNANANANANPDDPIGGIALDSYGPRKDLKGRGRGVTNRPAWLQERERKGLPIYDFVDK